MKMFAAAAIVMAIMPTLVVRLRGAPVNPVKLIIDTDIGGGGCNDVDDVVALCIANALVDTGEAELLAVVQNTAPFQCAGAISVLNTFYGRGESSNPHPFHFFKMTPNILIRDLFCTQAPTGACKPRLESILKTVTPF